MKRANGESDGPGHKRSNDSVTRHLPLHHPSQKFRLEIVIDNLSEYMDKNDHDVVGPSVIVGNSIWLLWARVESKNQSDSLAVYLLCQSPGTGWRIKIDYTATVVESEVHKAERGVKISENSDDPCVLSEEKEELLDPANGYVTDGTFKIEAVVTIYEPYRMLVDFFTADSNYNADAVLLVEDRRFHVNKAYLGHESDVFYQIFFGPLADSSREEVPLGDVDVDEFLPFLGAIHRMRAPITADNVEILVKLADRFQVDWLFSECEAYLLTSNHFSVVQKLVLSTKFNLDELQKKCMGQLTLGGVDELIGMGKENAMGVKLDGRLLQELLGKQKELMESKQKNAIKAKVNEVKHQMETMKTKMCVRCRNKLS
ncbi:BTB/POZ domain-containing protein [Aphelenchoides avenae]|nr:BTB/POZ domain-containing protein [Aphelenchus avenae]